MKTYYSIIYTSLSALGNERINLGLLLSQEDGISMMKFSEEKLYLLKKLLSTESFKLLKIQLSSFENISNTDNNLQVAYSNLRADYIQYLSNYTNNLISLTPPKVIDIDANQAVFDKLFEQYVYKISSLPNLGVKAQSNLMDIKHNFIPKVKDRVNVNFTLRASSFDFVVFDFNVDMIGKNEVPVLTQFIDFQTSAETIKHRVNNYVSLIKPFEIKENKIGKFFIVGQKPESNLSKQHQIWENLLKSPLIEEKIVEIVPPDELGSIQEYFEKHDVRPFEVE
ncbi:hypothetical protein [Belliella pelovolcani]|uniref:DUF3037 domain-containing protein n=1 Tax=Belliella pelovolcani TaxID=529505 RepID=A0A1N7KVA4_9BACT|nr:hypothetical protein [Belliella pelovolcani]SIS65533.1 hypothetical protein SAMN05421761_102373 [Belliella pelovolcani]